MTDSDLREIIITGIGVSPGICIGKAYLVDVEGVDIVEKYHISQIHVHSEIKRFKLAVKKAKNELRTIIENTPDAIREHVDILETHVILLNDKLLYGKIIETIEADFINAEWALKKVVSSLKAMFLNMSDIYLKERAIDIGHVSDRILNNLMGSEKINIAAIDKRVVLVATDLSPAQTSQIQLERVKGFITDQGGGTSHTSIIARTLGIPAVSGLDHATKTICSGDLIIVDGISGNVIVHPSEQTLVEYEERRLQYEIRMAALDRQSHLDAVTLDGKRFMVMGNIGRFSSKAVLNAPLLNFAVSPVVLRLPSGKNTTQIPSFRTPLASSIDFNAAFALDRSINICPIALLPKFKPGIFRNSCFITHFISLRIQPLIMNTS